MSENQGCLSTIFRFLGGEIAKDLAKVLGPLGFLAPVLAPLILIVIVIAGLFYGGQWAWGQITGTSASNKPATEIVAPEPTIVSEAKQEPQSNVVVSQLDIGKFTIQIKAFPDEDSAKTLVNKMAENNINSYYVKKDNPNVMYRVRVGYFNSRADATAFAKARLEPIGYEFWVDESKNDN